MMKRNSLKFTLLILFMVMILSVFSACSNNSDSTTESSGNDENKTDEKVEIMFQHVGGTVPGQDEVLDEMVTEFTKENPNIDIKIVNVGWGEAYSMFQKQVVVGEAPDLVVLNGQWADEYLRQEALAPINDYVSEEVLDQFIDSGFDSVHGDDGKVYGLPWDGSVWSFFYRKDLFEEAGLDPDKTPENWEELLEYAKKLTKDGQHGIAFPAAGWEPDDYFLPFMWQAGNDVVIKDGDELKSAINDEAGLQAANYVYDLSNTHDVMSKEVTGMDWEATMNSFIAGETAMMFNGMWVSDTLETNDELGGKWGTGVSPAGPAGQAVLGYPNMLNIPVQSEHKEIVGEFLEFIFTKTDDGQTYYDKYCEVTGVLGWTEDFTKSDFAQRPNIKPFVEQVPVSRNRPLVPKYEEFRQLHFNSGIQALILGKTTPEEFVEDMDKKFDELLQEE